MTFKEKYHATMLAKYGSKQAWDAALKEQRSKAGKAGGGKNGFANGVVSPHEAGEKGRKNRKLNK